MNEIERAIAQIKDHMRVHKIGKYPHIQLADALNMAIDALRAELTRQENAPLTCGGCKYDVREDGSMKHSRCGNCTRQERPWTSDRYEPKGESK